MANYQDHLYAVILAGGGGTRLWPKSRNKTPKQFLPLFGGETLMRITSKRFNKILPWEKIYCVTVSDEYKNEILREVPEFLSENIIVEPARRETGPAHAVGASYISYKDPDAVIITESADRLVNPVRRYLSTLKIAAKVAYEEGHIVSVGVKPRYPHTGLGHIKRGQFYKKVEAIKFYKVDKFIEKPPLNLAKRYTKSGGYYWNAGQYVWRADTLLKSFKIHAPEVSNKIVKIMDAIGTSSEKQKLASIYKLMPKISIDYAIAEKAKNMYVVPGDFFWTDIGDWKEVWTNLPQDDMGNVVIDGGEEGGRVINLDTSDALIHTDGRLIAVIDVDNVVIVDTRDALLVCSKSKAQNVKKIVNQLKEEGINELL